MRLRSPAARRSGKTAFSSRADRSNNTASEPTISNDLTRSSKLDQAIDLIAQLCGGNFELAQPPISGPPDELDKVLAGLGLLAGKLQSSTVPRECLRDLLQVIPAPALLVSPEGICEAANAPFEKLVGREAAELAGKPLLALISPAERGPGLLERLGRGPLQGMKVTVVRPEPPPARMELTSCAIRPAGGKCRGIIVALRQGRTPSQIAMPTPSGLEAALTAGDPVALVDVLESVPDPMSIADLTGKFIYVNSEFEKGTGWSRQEVLGRAGSDFGLFPPETLQRVVSEVLPALAEQGVVKNVEVACQTKQGEALTVLMSFGLLVGPDRRPWAVINVVKNITELRATERRVEHLNNVLKAIRNVNQLIVQERDRSRLISSTCQLLVGTRGYSRAWIALLRGPDDKPFFVQAPGESPATAHPEHGSLPSCAHQAISTAEVLQIPDPRSHCLTCPSAAGYQLDGAIVVRLEHAGRVFGVLGVAAPSAFIGDAEERALFEEVASDLGYALHNLDLVEERQNVVAALHESNDRYRTLFESTPQGLILADAESEQVQLCNEAFLKLFGYSREEARRLDLTQLHPTEWVATVRPELDAVMDGEKKLATNVPCRRRDGSVFLADLRVRKMALSGRESILAFITDATDRNRAELQLSEAQERLSLLFEMAPDAYYIQDFHGTVVDANRMAEVLSGYSRREIIGKSLYDLQILSPVARPRSHTVSEEMRASLRTPPEEYVCVRKDGSRLPVEVVACPVRIRGTDYVLGIARDISERKRMEQDLIRSGEELRKTTAQLIHRERLSALGELAANITHELNQPLNGIKLIAQSMTRYLDDYSPDQIKHDLGDVVTLVGTMSEIINHMRVFTRVHEDGLKKNVALNPVVEAALKLVAHQLMVLDIGLSVELAAEALEVLGDPVRLEQVVLNLLTNARNALETLPPDHPRRLQVRTFSRLLPGKSREVVLEVQDNGPGVAEELRQKIFQPFFTTREQGTGLGLSIARRIVSDFGGRIELEGEPGEGATFRVVLTAAR